MCVQIMSVYRFFIMLFVVVMCTPLLEASQCGRYQHCSLSCTEASERYISHLCEQYDPEDFDIDPEALTLESDFEAIMTRVKCEVFNSKRTLCDLSNSIRRRVTTNCSNNRHQR